MHSILMHCKDAINIKVTNFLNSLLQFQQSESSGEDLDFEAEEDNVSPLEALFAGPATWIPGNTSTETAEQSDVRNV